MKLSHAAATFSLSLQVRSAREKTAAEAAPRRPDGPARRERISLRRSPNWHAMKCCFGWKRVEDGRKVEIEVERGLDRQWRFYLRGRRNMPRLPFEAPLEDWLELLDAVKRRVGRRLMKPKDVEAIEEEIFLRFHQKGTPAAN